MPSFPSYRYHRELGARRVDSPADVEALGPGWVENPEDYLTGEERAAKRAAEPEAPPPPGHFGSTPVGYQPVPFPSYRFNAAGESRKVTSQAEVDALGPGWADNPSGPFDAPAPAADADDDADDDGKPAKTAVEMIDAIEAADADGLAALAAEEAALPKPRKTVLRAIEARQAALGE